VGEVCRIVDAAYERRSVALTSNLHPSGFDTIMPETLATATVDKTASQRARRLHHAHVRTGHLSTPHRGHRLSPAMSMGSLWAVPSSWDPLRAVFCQLHGTTWIAKSGDHPARRVCGSAVRPFDRCVMSVDVERWIVASCRWTWSVGSLRHVGGRGALDRCVVSVDVEVVVGGIQGGRWDSGRSMWLTCVRCSAGGSRGPGCGRSRSGRGGPQDRAALCAGRGGRRLVS
jgi:hypothetical protein